ncbi:MAG TPA: response regulator, partial [Pseudonocardiaceae bacterium]
TLARELATSRRSAERLAADAERLRLARELHDSVKQHAFVAALELASARSRLGPDAHLDAAAEAVAIVARQLGAVIEHVRPPQRELVPALREHLAGWSQRTGVAADLTVHAGTPLPAEPLLLVAIEALTNVARHAGAHRVAITLNGTGREAALEITDDGYGFDPARPGPAGDAGTPGRAGWHAGRALRPRGHHRHRALPGDPAVITILVAEDHPLVRRGIVGYLSTQPDLSVVAEAGEGAEAVRLAREHRPDVAVIDLQLPGIDGVETIRRLTRDCPGTRVVVLTSHEGDADIFPAIHAGALSYLLKEVSPEELAAAVRAAASGEAVLHPRVAARVVAELRSGRPDAPNALRDLTERELEVLRLLGAGLSNTEIAHRLVIGEKTVKTHVSAILMKLRLADRTQAAVHAWRHGVLRRETES